MGFVREHQYGLSNQTFAAWFTDACKGFALSILLGGLAVMALSILALVSTPVLNTLIRTQEYEADIFGLNTSRQPDGFAESALLLGEYRKLDPGPIEEFIFFDHPSGRTRIYSAMRWKAESQCTGHAVSPCGK
jgi:STE24 endopeptidase